MIRRYIIPAAALLGLVVVIGAVFADSKQIVPAAAAIPAAKAPYASYIAAPGIVESSSGNIAIGAPVSGIVTDVAQKRGSHVEAGDPLFRIDDRHLQAQLLPAIANVKLASVNLAKAKDHLKRAETLSKHGHNAISAEALSNRRFDVEIGEAALLQARAEVNRIKLEIERYTVRAPIAGTILQIKIHPGEFAADGVPNPPLMVLGDDRTLYIRTDIDEYDAWRLDAGAPAIAFGRGNTSLEIPLTYVRTEPLVIPKTSLTGNSTERTDTRVLQAIYSFDPANVRLYVGQLVDVYIKAVPVGTAKTGRS